MALIAAACLGVLIGCVLRFRSDVLAEGLALPLLIAGGFVILSSRTPLGVVAALLLTAYATVLTSDRARR